MRFNRMIWRVEPEFQNKTVDFDLSLVDFTTQDRIGDLTYKPKKAIY